MNGKSANINNAAKQIYPAGHDIPLTEVLCVFDADQVRWWGSAPGWRVLLGHLRIQLGQT